MTTLSKFPLADITQEWLHFVVTSHVQVQTARCGKHCIAFIALVWFLSRMETTMSCHISFLSKCLAANITKVRL